MKPTLALFLAAFGALSTLPAQAEEPAKPEAGKLEAAQPAVSPVEAAIRKALQERYPNIPLKTVSPSPVPGLYEVVVGGQVVYVDEKADYLLPGPLVDTRSKANLTKQRLEDMNKVDFSSLPLDKAIAITHGKGERKLAVFTDPDCPFCKQLEKELALLDNVTVYVFMYPLAELHPQAPAHAKAIWCSADRSRSWQDYLLEGKAPSAAGTCDNPVEDILALGQKLNVNGTPALIFANGKRKEGALPAAQIEDLLKAGS